jgi:hypothetical protein
MTVRHALSVALLALTGLPAIAAAQDVASERLWLPASATNLRPFLVMAVNKVQEDPACVEVLYARLNEYRTIYEEPTFTILCQKDPKTTFNRVVKITEVDPEYFAKLQAGANAASQAQGLNPEIEALRRQLLAPTGAQGSAPSDVPPAAQDVATPVAPVVAPAIAPAAAPAADL